MNFWLVKQISFYLSFFALLFLSISYYQKGIFIPNLEFSPESEQSTNKNQTQEFDDSKILISIALSVVFLILQTIQIFKVEISIKYYLTWFSIVFRGACFIVIYQMLLFNDKTFASYIHWCSLVFLISLSVEFWQMKTIIQKYLYEIDSNKLLFFITLILSICCLANSFFVQDIQNHQNFIEFYIFFVGSVIITIAVKTNKIKNQTKFFKMISIFLLSSFAKFGYEKLREPYYYLNFVEKNPQIFYIIQVAVPISLIFLMENKLFESKKKFLSSKILLILGWVHLCFLLYLGFLNPVQEELKNITALIIYISSFVAFLYCLFSDVNNRRVQICFVLLKPILLANNIDNYGIFALYILQIFILRKLFKIFDWRENKLLTSLLIYFLMLQNFYRTGLIFKYNSFGIGDLYLGFSDSSVKSTLITLFLQSSSSFIIGYSMVNYMTPGMQDLLITENENQSPLKQSLLISVNKNKKSLINNKIIYLTILAFNTCDFVFRNIGTLLQKFDTQKQELFIIRSYVENNITIILALLTLLFRIQNKDSILIMLKNWIRIQQEQQEHIYSKDNVEIELVKIQSSQDELYTSYMLNDSPTEIQEENPKNKIKNLQSYQTIDPSFESWAYFGETYQRNALSEYSQTDNIFNKLKNKKEIKAALIITLYNEEDELLKTTIQNIFRAIQNMKDQYKFTNDNFLVVIIGDGYQRLAQSFKEFAHDVGIYREDYLINCGLLKQDGQDLNNINEFINQKSEQTQPQSLNMVHFFSNELSSSQFLPHQKNQEEIKLNVMFGLKHVNKGTLNSFLIFLRTICTELNPEIIFNVDAGTIMGPQSFKNIVKHYDLNPSCGACNGEIKAIFTEPQNGTWFNRVLVYSQYYEYKLCSLARNFENLFGFQNILNGSWTTFRWESIKTSPLELMAYFDESEYLTLSQANQLKTEDRITIYSIIAQQNSNYKLHYIEDNYGETDVPDNLQSFIGQRKRWWNGKFFCELLLIKLFIKNPFLRNTKHSILYGLAYFLYNILSTICFVLEYLSFAIIFIFQRISLKYVGEILLKNELYDQQQNDINLQATLQYFDILYIGVVCLTIYLSINSKKLYFSSIMEKICLFWMLYSLAIFLSLSYCIFSETRLLSSTIYFYWNQIQLFMPLDILQHPIKYFIGNFCYILIGFIHTNVFKLYGLCNTNDVSWGNRPMASKQQNIENDIQLQKFSKERYYILFSQILINILFAIFVIYQQTELQLGKFNFLISMIFTIFAMINKMSWYLQNDIRETQQYENKNYYQHN